MPDIKPSIAQEKSKLNKRKDGQIVSEFKFGGNQLVYRVLSHLYDNSNIYLDRKYEKYLELKQLIISRS